MEQPTRILLVDDYEPFRLFLRLALHEKQGFRIVGEASDGLEAVQKAKELQPDLILLDIGLPEQNGIEAARHIRRLLANSKILFISQESDPAVLHKALSLDGSGYVLKAKVSGELLVAMESVIGGKQFIGSGLAVRDL